MLFGVFERAEQVKKYSPTCPFWVTLADHLNTSNNKTSKKDCFVGTNKCQIRLCFVVLFADWNRGYKISVLTANVLAFTRRLCKTEIEIFGHDYGAKRAAKAYRCIDELRNLLVVTFENKSDSGLYSNRNQNFIQLMQQQ